MSTPPVPKSQEDQVRWRYTSALWRVLYGLWAPDLHRRTEKQVGNIRTEAWGEPDISANIYKAGFSAVSVLYDQEGTIHHEDAEARDRLSRLVTDSGFWQQQQTVQRDTLGLRNLFLRVDIDRGMPTYRMVEPHWVVAKARPENPSVPTYVSEARKRRLGHKEVWTWETLNSVQGTYTITLPDGTDITNVVMGTPFGEPTPYPYVKSDGTPVNPYSMYSAKNVGSIWGDVYSTKELYEGTLNLGVKYTFLGHIERRASWPQRYIIGAQIISPTVTGDTQLTKTAKIVTDPSTVLMLEATSETQSPQIGAWTTSASISEFTEGISRYERRLAAYIGINAADLQRVSGDPKSGYALAVNQTAQRNLQRRYTPQFRRADINTITLTAILLNRYHEGEGTAGWIPLPEDGWGVSYSGIPLSPEEKKSKREDLDNRVASGRMDVVGAYIEEHPGISRSEAIAQLDRIRITNAAYASDSKVTLLEKVRALNPDLTLEQARKKAIEDEIDRLTFEAQLASALQAEGFGSPPKSDIALAPTDLSVFEAKAKAKASGTPDTTPDSTPTKER